jgi:hypothetical protein
MAFRFSTKLALAITAYLALVAAALTVESRLYVLVWAVAIVAALYAVFICIASRFRRPFALGFVILWSVHALAMFWFPGRTVPVLVLEAAGYGLTTDGLVIDPTTGYAVAESPVLQTVNAACALLAGLVGGALAASAYRRYGGPATSVGSRSS